MYLLPFVCLCVCASLFARLPPVDPSTSACVCAAGLSLSAALLVAKQSPAAAKRVEDATEVNHTDLTLCKSELSIPLS